MSVDIGQSLVAMLPRLRRYAMVLCRSQSAADDLVQSACERALATRTVRDPSAPFDAWMFTIVRNLWLDGLRRQKREGLNESIDNHLQLVGVDGGREMEARLTLAKLRDLIDQLPHEQREVLFLVCVEEVPYRDAAQVLSVPIGTVMSRLARARAKLAELAGLPVGSRATQ